ncbi:MAG: MFS transporter [Proteobacteria bacterium]|nr:MFS transporter [Pseudomonadota bacterium]
MDSIDAGPRRTAWTLGLCFLAALAEGFDVQSMGVAAPRMAPTLALTRDQLGPVFSASIVGLLVGAVLIGRLADRVGRRWTLIGSLVVLGVFSFVTVWAWDLRSLLVIRLLAGLGLGGAMPNLIALSAESVGEARRPLIVTLATAGMPFGAASAGAVAAVAGWRDIFHVGAALPLGLAAAMVAALPESPRFKAASAAPGEAGAGLPQVLFGQGRAATTLLLWSASFAALLTLYLLLNWLPTLMSAKGVAKTHASLVSMLFNLGGAAGVLTLAPLLDRGRRGRIMAVWYACTAASLIGLAWAGPDLASAGAAGFAAGAFTSAAPLMMYGLAPGFYAVVMRGSGTGAMVGVGRVGAILGPLLAAALLGLGFGANGVLMALLPLVAVAAIATLTLFGRPTVAD